MKTLTVLVALAIPGFSWYAISEYQTISQELSEAQKVEQQQKLQHIPTNVNLFGLNAFFSISQGYHEYAHAGNP